MAQHALTLDDKHARRDVILEAALNLFILSKGNLPSVAEIAAAADLAKGTVYLYFRTKEEIFLSLLVRGTDDLLRKLDERIAILKGNRSSKIVAFLDVYVRYLEDHTELLHLDAISHAILEKNLDTEKLLELKLAFIARLQKSASLLEQCFDLEEGRGVVLLMRTFALTRGIWQNYPNAPSNPEIAKAAALLYKGFSDETQEALTEYWRGALNP